MILNPYQYVSGSTDGPILLVTVTGATPASVTATKNGVTKVLTYDPTLGKWWAFLPSTGVWTVTATNSGGNTKSVSVSAMSVAIYETSMRLTVLPAGYTEREYIQSTGTQWIDLGLAPSHGFVLVADFLLPEASGNVYLLGAQEAGATRNGVAVSVNNGVFLGAGGYAYSTTKPFSVETKYHIEVNNFVPEYSATVDGISITFTPTSMSDTRTTQSCYMCALNSSGTPAEIRPLRLYTEANIYSDISKTTKISEIHVAEQNNVIGLYDMVRNQFLTNSGTGSFVGGPEL